MIFICGTLLDIRVVVISPLMGEKKEKKEKEEKMEKDVCGPHVYRVPLTLRRRRGRDARGEEGCSRGCSMLAGGWGYIESRKAVADGRGRGGHSYYYRPYDYSLMILLCLLLVN